MWSSLEHWASACWPVPEQFHYDIYPHLKEALQVKIQIGWNHFFCGRAAIDWETAYLEACSEEDLRLNTIWDIRLKVFTGFCASSYFVIFMGRVFFPLIGDCVKNCHL